MFVLFFMNAWNHLNTLIKRVSPESNRPGSNLHKRRLLPQRSSSVIEWNSRLYRKKTNSYSIIVTQSPLLLIQTTIRSRKWVGVDLPFKNRVLSVRMQSLKRRKALSWVIWTTLDTNAEVLNKPVNLPWKASKWLKLREWAPTLASIWRPNKSLRSFLKTINLFMLIRNRFIDQVLTSKLSTKNQGVRLY